MEPPDEPMRPGKAERAWDAGKADKKARKNYKPPPSKKEAYDKLGKKNLREDIRETLTEEKPRRSYAGLKPAAAVASAAVAAAESLVQMTEKVLEVTEAAATKRTNHLHSKIKKPHVNLKREIEKEKRLIDKKKRQLDKWYEKAKYVRDSSMPSLALRNKQREIQPSERPFRSDADQPLRIKPPASDRTSPMDNMAYRFNPKSSDAPKRLPGRPRETAPIDALIEELTEEEPPTSPPRPHKPPPPGPAPAPDSAYKLGRPKLPDVKQPPRIVEGMEPDYKLLISKNQARDSDKLLMEAQGEPSDMSLEEYRRHLEDMKPAHLKKPAAAPPRKELPVVPSPPVITTKRKKPTPDSAYKLGRPKLTDVKQPLRIIEGTEPDYKVLLVRADRRRGDPPVLDLQEQPSDISLEEYRQQLDRLDPRIRVSVAPPQAPVVQVPRVYYDAEAPPRTQLPIAAIVPRIEDHYYDADDSVEVSQKGAGSALPRGTYELVYAPKGRGREDLRYNLSSNYAPMVTRLNTSAPNRPPGTYEVSYAGRGNLPEDLSYVLRGTPYRRSALPIVRIRDRPRSSSSRVEELIPDEELISSLPVDVDAYQREREKDIRRASKESFAKGVRIGLGAASNSPQPAAAAPPAPKMSAEMSLADAGKNLLATLEAGSIVGKGLWRLFAGDGAPDDDDDPDPYTDAPLAVDTSPFQDVDFGPTEGTYGNVKYASPEEGRVRSSVSSPAPNELAAALIGTRGSKTTRRNALQNKRALRQALRMPRLRSMMGIEKRDADIVDNLIARNIRRPKSKHQQMALNRVVSAAHRNQSALMAAIKANYRLTGRRQGPGGGNVPLGLAAWFAAGNPRGVNALDYRDQLKRDQLMETGNIVRPLVKGLAAGSGPELSAVKRLTARAIVSTPPIRSWIGNIGGVRSTADSLRTASNAVSDIQLGNMS